MSGNVAVLMGGWSSERAVSLVSGNAVARALVEAGYSATAHDIGRDVAALLASPTPRPDVIFNALHGRWGEAGRIQGLLEIPGIPYPHSGVLASALAMNNPNSPAPPEMSAPSGDLTGPLVERVEQVLTQQVNPAIAAHGGGAELVSVDGTIAYLRLSGGCQGCGLAEVTLKQGIEKIILESIPDLTQVIDVTDHASGDNPYYESQKK